MSLLASGPKLQSAVIGLHDEYEGEGDIGCGKIDKGRRAWKKGWRRKKACYASGTMRRPLVLGTNRYVSEKRDPSENSDFVAISLLGIKSAAGKLYPQKGQPLPRLQHSLGLVSSKHNFTGRKYRWSTDTMTSRARLAW